MRVVSMPDSGVQHIVTNLVFLGRLLSVAEMSVFAFRIVRATI